MAVRLGLGLSGLILGYGIVTGPFPVRVLWPLLLLVGGFPAIVGLQTFALLSPRLLGYRPRRLGSAGGRQRRSMMNAGPVP